MSVRSWLGNYEAYYDAFETELTSTATRTDDRLPSSGQIGSIASCDPLDRHRIPTGFARGDA